MSKIYKFLLFCLFIFWIFIYFWAHQKVEFSSDGHFLAIIIFYPIYLIILLFATIIFIKHIKQKEKLFLWEIVVISILWIIGLIPVGNNYPSIIPFALEVIYMLIMHQIG